MVLVTGDGALGKYDEGGFMPSLQDMVDGGWGVGGGGVFLETLNRNLLKWTQKNGIFIALDDFYDSITFMEPGRDGGLFRCSAPLDMSERPKMT